MPLADADAYHFLLSFKLPQDHRITSDEEAFIFHGMTSEDRLELRGEGGGSVKDATRLRLSGHGYPTEMDAVIACKRARAALALAALECLTGVDFDETLTGRPEIWRGYRASAGIRQGSRASGGSGTDPELLRQQLMGWLTSGPDLTEVEVGCVELLKDFHFDLSNRSRFLLAFAAIEKLCSERVPKDASYVQALEALITTADREVSDGDTRNRLKIDMAALKLLGGVSLCETMIKARLGDDKAKQFKRLAEQHNKVVYGRSDDNTHGWELYQLALELLVVTMRGRA